MQARERDWLALATDSQSVLSQLHQQLPTLPQHTLLVGHEPDFSTLLSLLLGNHQPALKIRKASLTCLAYCEVSNSFQLEWSVPAKFM